jgi:hypothetical protein
MKPHAALPLAAAALLAAACTSSSTPERPSGGPSGAHTAFVAAVGQACARAVAAHDGHPFPLQGFDPEHPGADELPAVGNYFARYGGLPQTMAALHRLTPPAADAAAWSKLLELADQVSANAQRQIGAARAKDVTTFVRTVHTATRLSDELDTAGTRFGFTSESQCGKVFG